MAISLDKIRKDIKGFTMKGTASDSFTIATPNGSISVNTTGYNGKHWINFDSDGNAINSKSAHICLSESDLVELNYPVRNSNNEVFLYGHRVSSKDSSGLTKEYVIKEWFPDETFGLIVCILGDYELN